MGGAPQATFKASLAAAASCRQRARLFIVLFAIEWFSPAVAQLLFAGRLQPTRHQGATYCETLRGVTCTGGCAGSAVSFATDRYSSEASGGPHLT